MTTAFAIPQELERSLSLLAHHDRTFRPRRALQATSKREPTASAIRRWRSRLEAAEGRARSEAVSTHERLKALVLSSATWFSSRTTLRPYG